MKSLSILLSFFFGALLSCTVYAVDIPQDTDCQSKCDKLVKEKCQDQVDN